MSYPLLVFSVLLVGFTYHVASLEPVDVQVKYDSEGSPSFKVYLSGEEWLQSGSTGIRAAGQWWTSSNKDKYLLKLVGHSSDSGKDIIGDYTRTTFTWEAYSDDKTSAGVKVETTVNVYSNEPVVVFGITYLTGLANASIPNEQGQTLSTFPSFVVEETQNKRGYATWVGGQVGNLVIDKWSPGQVFGGQLDGGYPIVLFDSALSKTTVLSPLNTFMSANQYSFKDDQSGDTLMTFGPMSSIDTIPAGYKYSTILVGGNNVTGTMREFGEVLRRFYRKDVNYRKTDFTINYLGYWTDNGACYYYTTGSNYSNYEDLLVGVKQDADKMGLPYRYVQLDSWWYYKGEGGGVKNWTARPDIFPNGIDSMVKKTGWRPHAHNRWWAVDTDYAKNYKFIVEDNAALPVDPSFWDYLMGSSQAEWGLLVYEQDWLHTEFDKLKALQTQLNLGELWLKQMGDSAQRYGITIQYCMSWPRHLLQSVEIPAVTQIRVSGDYQPSNTQWMIGDSTILAHAVGLTAFKDNFRTSSNQPDCKKFGGGMTEHYPVLETYVSALSGGPVGPSDQMGTANVTLVMATCMSDGRLLQPTHPAMSTDSTIVQRAFGADVPLGYLTVAYTEINEAFTWYYVLAAELTEDYTMSLEELFPSHSAFPSSTFPSSFAFQYTLNGHVAQTMDIENGMKLKVSKCGKEDFQAWTLAPYFDNGWALLGELNKIVPVSEDRFLQIESDSLGNYTFIINGVPKEKVTVTFFEKKTRKTLPVECTIGDTGINVLSIPAGTCVGEL